MQRLMVEFKGVLIAEKRFCTYVVLVIRQTKWLLMNKFYGVPMLIVKLSSFPKFIWIPNFFFQLPQISNFMYDYSDFRFSVLPEV